MIKILLLFVFFFHWGFISDSFAGKARIEKTGQTESYAPGDDGDLQKGVEWPVPRFRDNQNGTITDRLSGLVWLKDANCLGTAEFVDWTDALTFCNDLSDGKCGLSDGSEPGEWRLPNTKEMYSLVDMGYYGPVICNTQGDGHWEEGDPFNNVETWYYWTSNTHAEIDSNAWMQSIWNAVILFQPKEMVGGYVWCVRSHGFSAFEKE